MKIKNILNMFKKKGGEIPINAPYIKSVFAVSNENEVRDAYSQVVALAAAVRSKARNISRVPFRIWTNDDREIEITADSSHPLTNLFEDVNPYYSKYELWEAIVTCLELYGEAFVIKDREEVDGIPVYLWPQSPKLFIEKVYRGRLVAWEYRNDDQIMYLYPDQVIYFKYYNPYNYYRGLSPISVLQDTIDLDYVATQYNKRFFKNDGLPGAVFETEQSLTDEQYNRLKDQLIESYRGWQNAHRAILLDGGVTVKDIGRSIKDMQFLELKKFTREDIAMITGVPKAELQLYEDLNYATAKTADMNYWKKTLIPLMTLIQDKINTNFLKPLGYWGEFDIDSTGILIEDVIQKADAAMKYFNMGVPFNVINERFSLGFPEVEETQQGPGDEGKGKEGIGKKLIGEKRLMRISEAIRGEKWRNIVNRTYPLLAIANKKIKNYFWAVEQSLIKGIVKEIKNMQVKAAGEELSDAELEAIARVIDKAFDDQKLTKTMGDVIKDALKLGFRSEDFPNEKIMAIMARRMNKIKGINKTGRERVKEVLYRTLALAMNQGVAEDVRAEMVLEAIRDEMKVTYGRARTIARTEVHGAFNEGQFEKTKSLGAKKIMWLTARDDRVRDTHEELDGMVREVGEPFPNGLLYPMDPNGKAEEVINCRCTFIEFFDEE